MTPLTYCDLRARSHALLRMGLLCRVAVLLVLVMSLAMALTHLRFMTRDMQIESSKLQKKRQAMINSKRLLLAQIEELKRSERLRQYAEQRLGLSVCPPDQSTQAMISSKSIAHWEKMPSSQANAPLLGTADENLIALVGEKMISWSSVSVARGSEKVEKN